MLREYDAAIIFSGDTDLLPAIELAYRRTEPKIELACWSSAKPLWFSEGLNMEPPTRDRRVGSLVRRPTCRRMAEGRRLRRS